MNDLKRDGVVRDRLRERLRPPSDDVQTDAAVCGSDDDVSFSDMYDWPVAPSGFGPQGFPKRRPVEVFDDLPLGGRRFFTNYPPWLPPCPFDGDRERQELSLLWNPPPRPNYVPSPTDLERMFQPIRPSPRDIDLGDKAEKDKGKEDEEDEVEDAEEEDEFTEEEVEEDEFTEEEVEEDEFTEEEVEDDGSVRLPAIPEATDADCMDQCVRFREYMRRKGCIGTVVCRTKPSSTGKTKKGSTASTDKSSSASSTDGKCKATATATATCG